MGRIDADTVYGTLGLLILRTLEGDSLHGLEIQRRIHAAAGNLLRVEEGALYPALHRLERDGCLESAWGTSDRNRRAKFYALTEKGARRLQRETEGWLDHVRGVGAVLGLELGRGPEAEIAGEGTAATGRPGGAGGGAEP